MLDLLIKNGTIIDGTGANRYKADIGINGDKIVKIGQITDPAKEIIEASDLIVSPGFIDMHSHAELSVLINPLSSSKIYQGITTEVVGNCGASIAPVYGKIVSKIKSRVEKYGLYLAWSSMGDYFNHLSCKGLATNLVSLVGHGLLRQAVVGYDRREVTKVELKTMKNLLENSLQEGAYGLSTGLIYPPSSYSTTEELVELAKVVAHYDGIYATHLRDEGDQLIEAVQEAIKIGKEAKVKVQISHHKAIGKNNWGKVTKTLKLIRMARKEGINVTCDLYPYLATSTGLSSLLPDWVFGGSKQEVIERMEDNKQEILDYLNQERATKDGWEQIIIAEAKNHKFYEGLTIQEIATKKGQLPAEFVFNLLISENLTVSMIKFGVSEDDLKEVLKSEFSMIGTDAISRVKDTILTNSHCHPRTYGTFPRIIDKYVKDKKTLLLEEAIKKMTYLPAKKLGIKRGKVAKKYFADLVLFDLKELKDRATYRQPHQYATGIRYLIVNGQLAIKDGEQTSNLGGYVLKN